MSNTLENKRIVLGVSGSVAAYKSPDVVRRLAEAGATVQVVMTAGAQAFITPLTLQAVSGRSVRTDLLDPAAESAMGHIELARWADLVLVAPASADFLARMAHGRADDLLGAVCLATTAPCAVAPAMNRAMWGHPATQHNLQILTQRGVRVCGPAAGDQACGEVGPGRMLEPTELVAHVVGCFATGQLAGLRVLVTAGPTREELDPVRYLSNRSSGKMGFAVARAAAEAGARVCVVSGPVHLATPHGVDRVDVESAEQMYQAVMSRRENCDILVAAAAVADYRPARRAEHKIKKGGEQALELRLEPTPDILAAFGGAGTQGATRPFLVGFAAETEALEANARAKLQAKALDMIAANAVGRDAAGRLLGFDADTNALHVMWPQGESHLPEATKEQLARQLVGLIAQRYHETRNPDQDSR